MLRICPTDKVLSAASGRGFSGYALRETSCSSILSAREPTEVYRKDELFADLLASAEKMVRIEKGQQMPKEQHVHTFSEIDVKAIREATGLKQQDFAAAVGVK